MYVHLPGSNGKYSINTQTNLANSDSWIIRNNINISMFRLVPSDVLTQQNYTIFLQI